MNKSLGGAAVLALANTVCRVLGFLFKIPLSNLIGSEGMGYFSLATQVFGVATFPACGGMPLVFGRYIAGRDATGKPTLPALKAVSPLFLVTGLVLAAVMGVFSGQICRLAGAENARPAVFALAPAVFFVAAESMYRAYFQGRSMLFPGALAQVCEAAGKLAVGTGCAWMLYRRGCSPAYIAGGAAAGVTFGTAVAAGVLKLRLMRSGTSRGVTREKGVGAAVLKESAVISLGSGIMSLLGAVDAAVIMNRLISLGLDRAGAASQYGIYTGYAVTVYALPFAITGAVSAWVTPAVAGAHALGSGKMLREKLRTAFKLSGCVGAFAAFCYLLMPGELLEIFFSRSEAELAAPMLSCLAVSVAVGPLCSILTSALSAMGKTRLPVVWGIVGGVVRVVVNYLLIGMPGVGMLGAPISAGISSLMGFFACLAGVRRELGRYGEKPGLLKVLALPCVCGLGSAYLARELCRNLYFLPGQRISALAGLAGGALVFCASAYLTGIVSDRELSVLFRRNRSGE